jgi:hypothetical protein
VSKGELKILQDRIAELEQRVGQLTEMVAPARALLDDTQRLEDLTERARRLSAAADTALPGIRERTTAADVGLPRVRPAFGVVHRAEVTGYVSVFFTGGRTDTLRLLVGWNDPPTECVCEANTFNELNSYAGGIVRKGEYWTLAGTHTGKKSFGYECVFTPLW